MAPNWGSKNAIDRLGIPAYDHYLVLQGEGKLVNKPTTTGGKKYDKFFLYIPTEMVRDSQFPLKEGQKVGIKVDAKHRRLIVEGE